MTLAGDAAKPMLLASLKLPVGDQLPDRDPLKAGILKLFGSYQARFKRAASLYAAESYDAALLAKEALSKVGGDVRKLPQGLEQIKNFAGMSGEFTFSPEKPFGPVEEGYRADQLARRSLQSRRLRLNACERNGGRCHGALS